MAEAPGGAAQRPRAVPYDGLDDRDIGGEAPRPRVMQLKKASRFMRPALRTTLSIVLD